MKRERGKEKEEKSEQGWPGQRPVVGEGARGRRRPAFPPPPLPGLGTRRRRRVDGGDLLLLLLMLLVVAKKATSSFLPIFCLKRLPPLPSQRASGLGCTPSEKRSRAKLLETEGILPLSLHHLGDFLFDFYFASWSKEEGGDPARPLSFPPLLCIFFSFFIFLFLQ